MTAVPITDTHDVVEDVDHNEVLVDVSSLPNVEQLDAEIQKRYPVETIETYFFVDPTPAEFRIYHIVPGVLAR